MDFKYWFFQYLGIDLAGKLLETLVKLWEQPLIYCTMCYRALPAGQIFFALLKDEGADGKKVIDLVAIS